MRINKENRSIVLSLILLGLLWISMTMTYFMISDYVAMLFFSMILISILFFFYEAATYADEWTQEHERGKYK